MLIWHPQAREDLLAIYVEIGLKNPDAAERFYSAVEDKADLLRRYPRMGVRRPEIGAAVRILIEGSYLLLHQTTPNTDEGPVDSVEVVRVVDARRDLTQPF